MEQGGDEALSIVSTAMRLHMPNIPMSPRPLLAPRQAPQFHIGGKSR